MTPAATPVTCHPPPTPTQGILASDESNATTGKRLESVGVSNTEDNRRAWRELLYTAPGGVAGGPGAPRGACRPAGHPQTLEALAARVCMPRRA